MTQFQVVLSDALFIASALAMAVGGMINTHHSPGNYAQHLRLRPWWPIAKRFMNTGVSVGIAACVYQTILWIVANESFYSINVPIRCVHFGVSLVIYFWYIRPGYLTS